MIVMAIDPASGEDRSGYVVLKHERNGVWKVLSVIDKVPRKWLRRAARGRFKGITCR